MVSVFVLTISCGTIGNTQQNTGRSNNNMRLLNPEDVVGRNLVGSDESGTYRFTLNQDGSLEYAVNDNIYYGKWTFDKNGRMYRYTFDWVEDGKNNGYIMDFLASGTEITLAGHWYLTDAYITFSKKLEFKE
jgi:hypothetical protein